MKLSHIFLLIVTAIIPLFFISCSEDNPVTPSAPLDTTTFTYPMKDGSYWKYNLTVTYSDFKPDSIKKYFSNVHATARVMVLYDTVINSVNTKCLFEEFLGDTIYREARYYYINTDTAFLLYAHRGFTSGFLPQKDDPPFFNIFDPPQKVLLYPVVTGKHWEIDTSNYSTKTYLGFENVNTQAGIITCMKTVRSYTSYIYPPNSLTVEYYDYYSAKGLVREHVFLDNMEVSTIQYPEGLGIADITGETILTEYFINP
ncbi:MAG: hypothetical protein EHM58_12320 [Ignavibacteriae bacterium]|nr:MAG: hypothetical protein EHM58_12320 [Ignavibacteriota bacterium]